MAKVIIRDARLAFPDVFEAVQYQGQGPFQYRSTFLIPAGDKQKTDMDAVIEQVAKDKWGAKAEAILKQIFAAGNKCCWVNGDSKAYNGYAGNWALTATRNQDDGRPLVVDRGKNPIAASDGKIYSGAYVNGIVEVWAQDNSFGKAIRATLSTVQWVKDGESFGGAAPASADGLDDLGSDYDDDDLI